MLAKVKIKGLDKAEAAANEILEHIDAIKKLQQDASWPGISVEIELSAEAASGN